MYRMKDGEYMMDELTKTLSFTCKKCGKRLTLQVTCEESGWQHYRCNHRLCSARYLVDVIRPAKPEE